MHKQGSTTPPKTDADNRVRAFAQRMDASDVGNQKEQDSDRDPGTDAPALDRGATPSNTAPSNYINGSDSPQILRPAIDSLYLSYPGTLAANREQELKSLKLTAQSDDEAVKSTAQLRVGTHLFEVLGRGQQKFPYILAGNNFRIQLTAASSVTLPMAYVQVSSEALTHEPLEGLLKQILFVLHSLGLVTGVPSVSRVDLCVDFTSPIAVDSWKHNAWVTRAHKKTQYYQLNRFSGWTIGMGGAMSARLYDKVLEIERSGKEYLKEIWSDADWNGDSPVWRLEFQFQQLVLKQLGVVSVDDLTKHLQGLWRYATKDWLRLSIPNLKDQNQTRWPTHPLWDDLSQVVFGHGSNTGLTRSYVERMPAEQFLFVNGLGGVTSFMAMAGIEDPWEGFREYIANAERYHQKPGEPQSKGLTDYVTQKVRAKGRKYNTIMNREVDKSQIEAQADAYRTEKDGE